MVKVSAANAVDKVILDLTARLEKAKRLRDAVDDPELASQLEAAFSQAEPDRTKATKTKGHKETRAKLMFPNPGSQPWKVLALFQKRGNEWMDMKTVMKDGGFDRGAISSIVYSQYPHLFEKRDRNEAGPGTSTAWKLKEATIKEFEQLKK